MRNLVHFKFKNRIKILDLQSIISQKIMQDTETENQNRSTEYKIQIFLTSMALLVLIMFFILLFYLTIQFLTYSDNSIMDLLQICLIAFLSLSMSIIVIYEFYFHRLQQKNNAIMKQATKEIIKTLTDQNERKRIQIQQRKKKSNSKKLHKKKLLRRI